MTPSPSSELSTRARSLLERDGHRHEINGDYAGRELILSGLTLSESEHGIITVELSYTGKIIYMEGSSGTIIRTSPDNILEGAIDALRQYMILEDMADV
jgi:hypothetical protein